MANIRVADILHAYSSREYLPNIRETNKMHLFAKRIFDMLHLIATPNQIAQLLAASRRQAGLTQAEAAARVGVSQSRISTWETDAAALTVAQLLALCGAYGLQLQMRDKNKPEFEPAPLIEW
ncbi:helix-turn-helix protein [Paraburkholderia sp. GV068]|jgi:HTH-type transcriptional regulator / antitoxin HipB|uniref:Helix-turn-helix domain protein n=2 Tax=Burkholderiaceae TaxID=119060 RepID=B1GBB5_PARG4|nr:helix-turn-helix domain protein [Paraburkholderia graminis C4D1M]PTQ93786.1 helix-turn-helix protein [Paraburkholderia sp. GV072]PUB00546.1 helix-turn-helix protein [Paraburkholderia sp. GV068]CAB3725486.1 hypothetical protein R8871_05243 [Paraburkholderia graminis C4D1M]